MPYTSLEQDRLLAEKGKCRMNGRRDSDKGGVEAVEIPFRGRKEDVDGRDKPGHDDALAR
jgi:hypothetical protein